MNEQTLISGAVRQAGYELMLLLSGAAALALRPTLRGAMAVEDMLAADRERRAELRRLNHKGLVETAEARGVKVLRLTEAGLRALDGGRDPELAWNRAWDGQWRMLLFDLPRDACQARVKFWRWLKANHFGKLQGSVWITPDPVTDLATTATHCGLDPTMLMLFTGNLEGQHSPSEIATTAWDFEALSRSYRDYLDFGQRSLRQLGKLAFSPPHLAAIARADRKHWWEAVRRDPLLPKSVLPPRYLGFQARQIRRELHAAFTRTAGHFPPC